MQTEKEERSVFRRAFRRIALPIYFVIIAAVIVGLSLRSAAVYYPALIAFVILIILEKAFGPSTRVLDEGNILYRIRSTYRRLWEEHLFTMSFSYMQLVLLFILLYDRPRFDIYLIISIIGYEAIFLITYYFVKQWKRNRSGDLDSSFKDEDDEETSSDVGEGSSAGPIITSLRKEKHGRNVQG